MVERACEQVHVVLFSMFFAHIIMPWFQGCPSFFLLLKRKAVTVVKSYIRPRLVFIASQLENMAERLLAFEVLRSKQHQLKVSLSFGVSSEACVKSELTG